MAGDRLSELSDDLLRRILHFAPVKEAASTSALARRFRSVWRSSGAINFDTRSHPGYDTLESKHGVFLDCVDGAFAGHDDRYPVRRLTFHVEGEDDNAIKMFMSCYWRRISKRRRITHEIVADALSQPAARPVEELCVNTPAHTRYGSARTYSVSISSLPYEALRVLDMSHARLTSALPDRAAVAFPALETMRLYLCDVCWPLDLQIMFDAAPMLATLGLEGVYFQPSQLPTRPSARRLRCPKVTTLVLANVNWWAGARRVGAWEDDIELDVPLLRYFRFKGAVRPIQLVSPTPDITRVDLHFYRKQPNERTPSETDGHRFLQFVDNFSSAKVWNVTGDHLQDMIAAGRKRGVEILAT